MTTRRARFTCNVAARAGPVAAGHRSRDNARVMTDPLGPPGSIDSAGSELVSLQDWCREHGLNHSTVRRWKVRGVPAIDPQTAETVEFPAPVGKERGNVGRDLYVRAALDAYYAAKEKAIQATGGRREPIGTFDPDEYVSDWEAARRLGYTETEYWSTFRHYDDNYARNGAVNRPPDQRPDGTRRWGDWLAWNDQRAAQGRRRGSPGTARPAQPSQPARVAERLRTAIHRREWVSAATIAEFLGVAERVAQSHLDTAARDVIAEMGLRSRADIAAEMPGGAAPGARDRIKRAARRPDAPKPVLRYRRALYYLPEDADRLRSLV